MALLANTDSILTFTMSDQSTGKASISAKTAAIAGTHAGTASWDYDEDPNNTIEGAKAVIKIKSIKVNVTSSVYSTHVTDATGEITASVIKKVTMSGKTPLAVGDKTTATGGKNMTPSESPETYTCDCEITDAVQTTVTGK